MAATAAGQSSRITGRLTYPGEGIPPDLAVCVERVSDLFSLCSNSTVAALRKQKMRFKVERRFARFEVDLPAGTYYLYAVTPEMPGHRAYYNAFVKCGMNIDCRSTRNIPVRANRGKVARGVVIGDFWNHSAGPKD
jgi:hypothetical protein